MNKLIAVLYCLSVLAGAGYSSQSLAAPFVTSDPTSQATLPTHCGEYIYKPDSAGVLQPVFQKDHVVATDSAGKPYCKIDVASYPAGNIRMTATFVRNDGIYPRVESPLAAPLNFSKPGSLTAPLGITLKP